MHPYRGIVCTERWSDGLSTIRYGPNTLNFQFGGTNNASPGTQLGGPITPHTQKRTDTRNKSSEETVKAL